MLGKTYKLVFSKYGEENDIYKEDEFEAISSARSFLSLSFDLHLYPEIVEYLKNNIPDTMTIVRK